MKQVSVLGTASVNLHELIRAIFLSLSVSTFDKHLNWLSNDDYVRYETAIIIKFYVSQEWFV